MNYHYNWNVIWQNQERLLSGLLLGLEIAVFSLLIGCVIGLLGAFARTSRFGFLRGLMTAYVEFIRNVPLLLFTYFAFFGLPKLGISFLDNTASFVVALALYSGAYLTEVFRAGIGSIPHGYIEAGKAIGLTTAKRVRFIVLPVMFRMVLPSLSNTLISLFKDTSIASAIGVTELTYAATYINVNTFRVIEAWVAVTVLYLITGYSIALLLRLFERRFAFVQ
jgi:polar amino acid transport system permease protein